MFHSKNIIKKLCQNSSKFPELNKIKFGNIFSKHILSIDWDINNGWDNPIIQKYDKFNLDPASSVFHYGFSAFEGMKAYQDLNKEIRLFRPECNMKRFNKSSEDLLFPVFNGNELLDCIKELINIDREWIPNEDGYSLYIRPTIISTDPDLSVRFPNYCKIFTILSPVGPYYKDGFFPISLLADEKYVRSWPGGTGDKKIGGNYAPTLKVQKIANNNGHSQVLWLNNKKISEVGTMNIFFIKIKNNITELITPRLDGTILPGITRDSIIELCKYYYPEIIVKEIDYTIDELINDFENKYISEIFGTGTAAVISPVNKIQYNDNIYETNQSIGFYTKDFYNKLKGIQLGNLEDPFNWSHII